MPRSILKKVAWNIIVVALLCVSTSVALGQWLGPDVSQKLPDDQDFALSQEFLFHAQATLKAAEAANTELDGGRDGSQSLLVMMKSLDALEKTSNLREDVMAINIARRVLVIYLDSIMLTSNQASASTKQQGLLDVERAIITTENRECIQDLQLRLAFQKNPKCEVATKRVHATLGTSWIGPPSLEKVDTPWRAKLELALTNLETFLRELKSPFSKREDQENAFKQLSRDHTLLRQMLPGADKRKAAFIINTLLISENVISDSIHYGQAISDSPKFLPEAQLAIAKDEACVNDIRRRLDAGTDSDCGRLLVRSEALRGNNP